MNKEATISIITETSNQSDSKGFLPGLGSGKDVLQKTDISINSIKEQLSGFCNSMASVGGDLSDLKEEFQVSEISFSLTLDAKGEFSLLGLMSGSVGGAGTVQVVLKRDVKNE